MFDVVTIEMSKLQREALRRLQARMASEQLGELFKDIDTSAKVVNRARDQSAA